MEQKHKVVCLQVFIKATISFGYIWGIYNFEPDKIKIPRIESFIFQLTNI